MNKCVISFKYEVKFKCSTMNEYGYSRKRLNIRALHRIEREHLWLVQKIDLDVKN